MPERHTVLLSDAFSLEEEGYFGRVRQATIVRVIDLYTK